MLADGILYRGSTKLSMKRYVDSEHAKPDSGFITSYIFPLELKYGYDIWLSGGVKRYLCYIRIGRQREPSVKSLRSPLSAEYWRHCLLSGRTQRRALPRHQSEEMEIQTKVNTSSPRVGIEPTTSHTLCPCATTGLVFNYKNTKPRLK